MFIYGVGLGERRCAVDEGEMKKELSNGMIVSLGVGLVLILVGTYLAWLPLGLIATGLMVVLGVVLTHMANQE